MAKRRVQVPAAMVAAVQFNSDMRCCVCEGARPGHHIHHIDGDPGNNEVSNLVLLCFDHHEAASKTGGLSRKLDSATIRRYMDWWHDMVSRRRNAELRPMSGSTESGPKFEVALQAVQVAGLRTNWRLADLNDKASFRAALTYANALSKESGHRIRFEALEVAAQAAGRVRARMPIEMIRLIASIACNAAVQIASPMRTSRQVSKRERELLAVGSSVGYSLVHDGATYLEDLKAVDAGADVLWLTLRCATANRLTDVQRKVLENFEWAIGSARKAGLDDAVHWLEFQRADALALRDADKPEFPQALAGRVLR